MDLGYMLMMKSLSWIYAYDEIPITDKMIFKANHNLFICNLAQVLLYIILKYFFKLL